MAIIESRSVEPIVDFIKEVTPRVFENMLSFEVKPGETIMRVDGFKPFLLTGLNGGIGFGGQLTGTLFLSLQSPIARAVGEAVLGEVVAEDSRELMDVVGELTNMLAGGVKTRLCDTGLNIVMSIPSLIRGPSIRVAGKNLDFSIKQPFTITGIDAPFAVFMLGKMETN